MRVVWCLMLFVDNWLLSAVCCLLFVVRRLCCGIVLLLDVV